MIWKVNKQRTEQRRADEAEIPLQTTLLNNTRETLYRTALLRLLGIDGTGRYPDTSGRPRRQFGWNRGSYYTSSRPLQMQGMGAFL